MHALIVVAHPQPGSLTHAFAEAFAEGVASNSAHTAEIADLAAEGFDPRFSDADMATFHRTAPAPADVLAEQARIDRADALALVYPVYWWSFPALLKGWIDRVFSNGWAYDETPEGGVVKRLQRMKAHLIAVGGADLRTLARRGYQWSMRTQIEQGIFDYCGATVVQSEFFLPPQDGDWSADLAKARSMGAAVFNAPEARAAA